MVFILKTIIQWRRFVLLAGVLTAALMAVVSLILPKWYTATASVFPPQTNLAHPIYMELLESFQRPILGPAASGAHPNTIYIDILLSRRVGERLIEEFNFKSLYKADVMIEAIKKLHSHTFLTLLDNGLIKISFEDRDPSRAAAVADRYVALLDEFNQQLNVTRASKTREFIEGQLAIHERELRAAEDELRAFQEDNKALSMDEQVQRAIEMVAGLTSDAIALEIDLQILGQYASRNSDEYVRKKRQYDEIVGQLKKLKVNREGADNDVLRSYFPTLENVPRVALDLFRLTRRVKVEEKVYEMLVQEYEKARIEEARDTPTVQILDRAQVPELRSRPKRKVLVILGAVVGLAWSSLLAVFLTAWREQRERGGTIAELFLPLTADFRRLFRRRR